MTPEAEGARKARRAMEQWVFGVWAFGAGVLVPVMAALSGGLGRSLSSPGWAAALLFSIALSASLVVALATTGVLTISTLKLVRPEQLGAGLIVAFYVLSAAYLTPRFGVAPTVLLVVLAQIMTSALLSHFGWLGAPRQPVTAIKAVGLVLMIAGLLLVQAPRRLNL